MFNTMSGIYGISVFRPYGAPLVPANRPTAFAVGCILAPLRGYTFKVSIGAIRLGQYKKKPRSRERGL